MRYTLNGDLNLDGACDVSDLAALAANYGLSGKVWMEGDVNYDGIVDLSDSALLNANYGSVLSGEEGFGMGEASRAGDGLADYILQARILGDLREKVAEYEPQRLAEFDAMTWLATSSGELVAMAFPADPIAVPEPGAGVFALLALIGLLRRHRRPVKGVVR